MPSAEILTIGTEILLGELIDTNAPYIARALRDLGIDIFRKSSVGDNTQRISEAIREAMSRAQIIITTGGLGPTVDDPTRQAIADAVGVELEFRDELWEQITTRYARYGRTPSKNNTKQALIPRGAIGIENPVGTAPAFIVESGDRAIIALPGVPREMEHLLQTEVLPYIRRRFPGTGIIRARILHTAGAGESNIDELISDLEELTNPTVGLAAHSGVVDIRITAKAADETQADALIAPVEADLRNRLGDMIFGADGDSLEQVALAQIATRGWKLAAVEIGLGGELIRRLTNIGGVFAGGEILPSLNGTIDLQEIAANARQIRQAELSLVVALKQLPDRLTCTCMVNGPGVEVEETRYYGGPPKNAPIWAANIGLNMLRKI